MNTSVKEQVRKFYETIGWRQIGEGLYQNARYEDLRPVSREYLRRCHLRVSSHLPVEGKYLLDAGSGPIQYPEYLQYSEGFDYRVCLDISRLGLTEARARLGVRGLYVVGDVAHLPFVSGAFEGLVSLHTVHHLPPEEHRLAFGEFMRSLRAEGRGVVVYSWGRRSGLMRIARPLITSANLLRRFYAKLRRKNEQRFTATRSLREGLNPARISQRNSQQYPAMISAQGGNTGASELLDPAVPLSSQPGTFTFKHDYRWFRQALADFSGMEILVWRAVSTQFLRALIHHRLYGEKVLKVLLMLEERLPHFLGRHGQYPMIVFRKPSLRRSDR